MTESLKIENQICFPLYAASRLTTQLYQPLLKPLELTYPQYLVMLVLWEHNEMTVKEIGKILYLQSNTLTPLLKRLQDKKLVKRHRSTTDERRVFVSLTAQGQELQQRAKDIPSQIQASLGQSNANADKARPFQQDLQQLIRMINEAIESNSLK